MKLQLIGSIAEVRAALSGPRRQGAVIGLVPTMGALHAGHGSLIDRARRECGVVAVSLFVNPIQFNQSEDYERYPRPLESDLEFCEQRGVAMVFAPTAPEMYPEPQKTFVEVAGISEPLCGRFRPGHFRGVATVVAKLFQIVQPDRAYFGEKDAQQLAVIRRMTRELNMPVEIVEVPTVREPDGLALSSRNRHLSAAEREAAAVLHRALRAAERRIAEGASDTAEVRAAGEAELAREPLARPEYLEVVDPETMEPVSRIEGAVRLAGAIWIGTTRLIDTILCEAAIQSIGHDRKSVRKHSNDSAGR